VIAALSINLILGVLYAWSVMGKALVLQWHRKAAEASLPFTISAASFALMMIFAGRWQDKIGPRYVAMLGGIILGLGLIASLRQLPLRLRYFRHHAPGWRGAGVSRESPKDRGATVGLRPGRRTQGHLMRHRLDYNVPVLDAGVIALEVNRPGTSYVRP
jgi:hypothetical protein